MWTGEREIMAGENDMAPSRAGDAHGASATPLMGLTVDEQSITFADKAQKYVMREIMARKFG